MVDFPWRTVSLQEGNPKKFKPFSLLGQGPSHGVLNRNQTSTPQGEVCQAPKKMPVFFHMSHEKIKNLLLSMSHTGCLMTGILISWFMK